MQVSKEEHSSKPIIKYHRKQAQYFSEDLGNGISLDMVAIPGGTFLMGSPSTEEGHTDRESPQHQVTVKSFFMGKYPITQAQWQVVAALPKVNSKLEANPSRFKGANRPVEQVSWYDAVEFCKRLSDYTKRPYCLPSEAKWEYACRARTITPFHFGETITTDLANYRGTDDKDWGWSGSYGQGSKGTYRRETTEVGSFKVANNFGLYDMHGNVWEWCADSWHDNYQGAPTDGSAWEDNNESQYRPSRGGSWYIVPVNCLCASRGKLDPADRREYFGFRVVCASEWTL